MKRAAECACGAFKISAEGEPSDSECLLLSAMPKTNRECVWRDGLFSQR